VGEAPEIGCGALLEGGEDLRRQGGVRLSDRAHIFHSRKV
jgi:hypothetical protein